MLTVETIYSAGLRAVDRIPSHNGNVRHVCVSSSSLCMYAWLLLLYPGHTVVKWKFRSANVQ